MRRAAAACDVIRPPNDLPPANNGVPGNARAASSQAARTAACATAGGSGRFAPCCMNGNWKRSVATPRAARPSANAAMNGWPMPAPAPWAKTYAASGSLDGRTIVASSGAPSSGRIVASSAIVIAS